MSKEQFIVIEADTNDGDYITNQCSITEEELATIMPVIAEITKLKAKGGNTWDTREWESEEVRPEAVYAEVLTQKQISIFNDYVPYGEFGVHSIERITIIEEIATLL